MSLRESNFAIPAYDDVRRTAGSTAADAKAQAQARVGNDPNAYQPPDQPFPGDRIRLLASQLSGDVVTAEDADYDSVRAIVPANYDPRPLAVIRVANALDVAKAVPFAHTHGLEVAVRSGGHSRHIASQSGIVVDLRLLNQL